MSVDVDSQAVKDDAEAIYTNLKEYFKFSNRFFYSNCEGSNGEEYCYNLVVNNGGFRKMGTLYVATSQIGRDPNETMAAAFLSNNTTQIIGLPADITEVFDLKPITSSSTFVPPSSFTNVREVIETIVDELPVLLHVVINLFL